MSCESPRIEALGLAKTYHIYRKPQHRLLQSIFRGRRQFHGEFHALSDISLTVGPGETVGVLGRNGSGKSTLLQLIAGTVRPTRGTVHVRGRVAAILELGAGFNPEFTGRENVELSASLHGMRPVEVVERMPDILQFADLDEFIDRPVKLYSNGMYARLAFSVAIHVDPEVLIVDEALAVGDAKFQAQCFRKFEEFKARGVTILFVSHSVDQIARHCSRALLLERGRMTAEGDPKPVIASYLESLFGPKPTKIAVSASAAYPSRAEEGPVVTANGPTSTDSSGGARRDPAVVFGPDVGHQDAFGQRHGYNRLEHRWGDGRARIVDFRLLDESGRDVAALETGSAASLYLAVRFNGDVRFPIYGMTVKTPDGVEVAGANSQDSAALPDWEARTDGDVVTVRFEFNCRLNAGDYLISVGVAEAHPGGALPLDRRYDAIHVHVVNARKVFGLVDLEITPSVTAMRRQVESVAD